VKAVDTNVLVFARREELPLHPKALKTLRELAEGDAPWGVPLASVVELVRVVTHPRLFSPPSKPAAALQFVADLPASPSARLLVPGPTCLPLFERLVSSARATGNLVFDAQIAAQCLEHGATVLVTEGRDFARFRDLESVSLAD
jgi:hypothetical protein